jgi:hypothetical protein
MMTNALLEKFEIVRNWLSRTSPWMMLTFAAIEDQMYGMECHILTLEEENQRLKSLLHGQVEPGHRHILPMGNA